MAASGYWPSRWPGEDGGPHRRQVPSGGAGLGIAPGEHLEVTSREALAGTMVVLRDAGEAYLLRHTGGDDAISWVERFDPETLEVIERSPDLPGGPTWPGGMATHANGSLYVVFGKHVHRLAADCSVMVSRELPTTCAVQQLPDPAGRSSGDQGLRRLTPGRPRLGPGHRAVRAARARARRARDRGPAGAVRAVDRPAQRRRRRRLRGGRHQPAPRRAGPASTSSPTSPSPPGTAPCPVRRMAGTQ